MASQLLPKTKPARRHSTSPRPQIPRYPHRVDPIKRQNINLTNSRTSRVDNGYGQTQKVTERGSTCNFRLPWSDRHTEQRAYQNTKSHSPIPKELENSRESGSVEGVEALEVDPSGSSVPARQAAA